MAPTPARLARDRAAAGLDAESTAPRARRQLGQLDLALHPGGGVLEGDRHLVRQILTGYRVGGPAPAVAGEAEGLEDVVEQRAQNALGTRIDAPRRGGGR